MCSAMFWDNMRVWCGVAALSWACALAGGHAPNSEWPETVRGYAGYSDERFASDTYTTANINITYEDEHGEIYTETSESGKFGEGVVGSATGLAVHVQSATDPHDHTGCTWPLLNASPGGRRLPDEAWIAVVRRGNCNFEVKVQNAWRANASAVLIYNDRDTAQLEKMKLNTETERNISAVFTFKWKGEEITRLLDNGTRVTLGIIRGRNCIRTYNNINRTSVLFVSISFIVLMIISLAWLVFYYIQRFRYIHAKDRLSKRLCCAAKKALSKIPVKSLKTEDREVQGDGECCAVCIEPYKVSDTLRSLPCRHEFHKSCIDPWLLEHRTCPMCKMDILKYYGFVFTGSQESILQLDHEEARGRALGPASRSALARQITSDHYEEAGSERSSRASSPDELTPSLRSPCGAGSRPPSPGRQGSAGRPATPLPPTAAATDKQTRIDVTSQD